ncbi:hypothetical protein GCM10012275_27730 [Longimycelium tulufanense]|uniref:Uncharacterized protein n=1 Tax=Longimycelium tulufanense TaxID=907463 RepID=A0A8J3FWQ3_9PSEU|nr:hypothetical protein [Longimycelium tulufanense]GGM55089.1 hypothetical protein GCM10012275_27730 [Longimycelium tulufanense]
MINYVLPLIGLFLLLVVSIYVVVACRGTGVPLGVFGIVSIVMFTLNSNLISVHRYVLPCLVLYVTGALMVERRRLLAPPVFAAIFFGVVLQSILFTLFVAGRWAG